MKILVTGGSGFIGKALIARLLALGNSIVTLTRNRSASDLKTIHWDPVRGELNLSPFEPIDAVIHLAGENIASGLWTKGKKERIRQSRIGGTELLVRSLLKLTAKPKVLISASAIGYYGNRAGEFLDETSSVGTGFLATLVHDWELATAPARDAGIRVVNLRIGLVLSPEGGVLAKMLPVFRLGLGGRLGRGEQFMSWVTLSELVEILCFTLNHTSISGPVNVVSPNPVSNAQFTEALGSALGRPTLFSVPAQLLKFILGEMAEELLLSSARVVPVKLIETDYNFKHGKIGSALQALLEPPAN